MTYQKLIVVGNLGRDPEMRYMPDGQCVTNFSIATTRTWTNQTTGQRMDETTWFRIATWGRRAESCNDYLRKGHKVLVEGRLIVDPQTGGPKTYVRQDGSVGANFQVNADTVRFLTPKGDEIDINDYADAQNHRFNGTGRRQDTTQTTRQPVNQKQQVANMGMDALAELLKANLSGDRLEYFLSNLANSLGNDDTHESHVDNTEIAGEDSDAVATTPQEPASEPVAQPEPAIAGNAQYANTEDDEEIPF